MDKSVKFPVTSLKGLLAGTLLAGAVGLGFAGGDRQHKEGSKGASGPAAQEEGLGVGGSQGPGMQGAAALPPNVAPGWKIRVCSEKTKAQSVSFRISDASQKQGKQDRQSQNQGQQNPDQQATGQSPDQATGTGGSADPSATQAMGQEMASWSAGDPSLITIPESFARTERIRIEAIPGQDKMKTSACVLYNDHVAKKIDFDSRKEFTVKMDDNATCGC